MANKSVGQMEHAKCNQWHLITTGIKLICVFQDFKTTSAVKDNHLLELCMV